MQHRHFATLHLLRHQARDEPLRIALALRIGVRADAADLAQRAGGHAFAGHRHEAAVGVEAADVLAEFDGARGEGPGARQVGQGQHLFYICRAEPDYIRERVGHGRRCVPDHLHDDRFHVDLPGGRRGARPADGIEVLVRRAEGQQRVEVGVQCVGKTDDGGEACGVPACGRCTAGIGRMRARKGVPGEIREEVCHGTGFFRPDRDRFAPTVVGAAPPRR
ncbi:hypothetical protein D9M72_504390 [compost metagenome]